MKTVVMLLSLLALSACKYNPETYDDPVPGFGSNGHSPNLQSFIYADNDGKTYYGDEPPLAPTSQITFFPQRECNPERAVYPRPTAMQKAHSRAQPTGRQCR